MTFDGTWLRANEPSTLIDLKSTAPISSHLRTGKRCARAPSQKLRVNKNSGNESWRKTNNYHDIIWREKRPGNQSKRRLPQFPPVRSSYIVGNEGAEQINLQQLRGRRWRCLNWLSLRCVFWQKKKSFRSTQLEENNEGNSLADFLIGAPTELKKQQLCSVASRSSFLTQSKCTETKSMNLEQFTKSMRQQL